MNLSLHGLTFDLGASPTDSFFTDQHQTLKADFILANPPFNMSRWGAERLASDARWRFGIPPEGNANFAWVQHIASHMAAGGTAGIVLANGSMTSDQPAERRIRQGLIMHSYVDCMVSLPPQLFYSTTIPVCLWVLRNGRKLPVDRTGEVLMIDAREMGTKVTRTHRILSEPEVDRIAGAYRAWREGKSADSSEDRRWRSVPLDEIERNDFVLAPSRYVASREVVSGKEDLDLRQVAADLRSLMAEVRDLDARIEKGLEEVLSD